MHDDDTGTDGIEAAPIIVSALFGPADFAWLDGLRRTHFPPDRNVIAAHLTLFHHLPPTLLPELAGRLKTATSRIPRPEAMIDRVMSLGRGVALGVRSPALLAIRAELADAFTGCLTPQDQAGWRPHVTIQNKVPPAEARALQTALSAGFSPRPLVIAGLAAHHYRGGPWQTIARYPFSG
ncbi:2'-5' RNA ligase family protein [Sphingomonas solaris]|uniref:2'-5' RNA ligase family protein n=1 Tax=Alterirhizorhabdus solaris TaxID=2529389 RepID=A0A558RBQ6_9SPHN|nr:2'-5' RNA ligase family protein [Sphingomonas solaris]TVV76855.1 2'-5' RNA ligase family protein [Sphingomonas solaris]